MVLPDCAAIRLIVLRLRSTIPFPNGLYAQLSTRYTFHFFKNPVTRSLLKHGRSIVRKYFCRRATSRSLNTHDKCMITEAVVSSLRFGHTANLQYTTVWNISYLSDINSKPVSHFIDFKNSFSQLAGDGSICLQIWQLFRLLPLRHYFHIVSLLDSTSSLPPARSHILSISC